MPGIIVKESWHISLLGLLLTQQIIFASIQTFKCVFCNSMLGIIETDRAAILPGGTSGNIALNIALVFMVFTKPFVTG